MKFLEEIPRAILAHGASMRTLIAYWKKKPAILRGRFGSFSCLEEAWRKIREIFQISSNIFFKLSQKESSYWRRQKIQSFLEKSYKIFLRNFSKLLRRHMHSFVKETTDTFRIELRKFIFEGIYGKSFNEFIKVPS